MEKTPTRAAVVKRPIQALPDRDPRGLHGAEQTFPTPEDSATRLGAKIPRLHTLPLVRSLVGSFALLAASVSCTAGFPKQDSASKIPDVTAPLPPAAPDSTGCLIPFPNPDAKPTAPFKLNASERVTWQATTQAPQTARPSKGIVKTYLTLCGAEESALSRVAQWLTSRAPTDLDLSEITFALRAQGAPYVWPRAWMFKGTASQRELLQSRLTAWLHSFSDGGVRRCGISVVQNRAGVETTVVIVVDALANLQPVPIRVQPHHWVKLEANLLVPASDAKLVVLGPRGLPQSLSTALSDGRIRTGFWADQLGPFLVQVIAHVAGGPRQILEAQVFSGVLPPEVFSGMPAPGEYANFDAYQPNQALLTMVNTARRGECLPPLVQNPQLDQLAQQQAESIRSAQKVAHDVGHGDPQTRLEASGFPFRIAGENLAHATDIARAHRALWASPSHRANILHPHFNSIGIGIASDQGSVWVCEVFADAKDR